MQHFESTSTFETMDEILCLIIQMKPLLEYLHMVLVVFLRVFKKIGLFLQF